MANPLRGQVSFESEGKTYKLSFSTNSLSELEERLNMSVTEIGTLMSDPIKARLKTMKIVFWAGLQDCQPGILMDEVSKILSNQLPQETSELINKTFALTWPKESKEEGGAARPPEAAAMNAGNGQAFSPPGNP